MTNNKKKNSKVSLSSPNIPMPSNKTTNNKKNISNVEPSHSSKKQLIGEPPYIHICNLYYVR